jgi:hypothetical protein
VVVPDLGLQFLPRRAEQQKMTVGALQWVTVKDAASSVGVTESRLRTAYRNGRVSVREDLVDGRVRKLVDIDEVRSWAGVPSPVETAPVIEPVSPAARVDDARPEELSDRVKTAVARATRAEDQVSLLRNELAQLREVYQRVSDTLARREAAEFEASVRSMCAAPSSTRRRRTTVFGLRRRATT